MKTTIALILCFLLTPTITFGQDPQFTSELHKEHVNGMVFSNTRVQKSDEDRAQLSSSFDGKSTIYGRVYFSELPIKQVKGFGLSSTIGSYFFTHNFYKGTDTEPFHSIPLYANGRNIEWTTMSININGNEKDKTRYKIINKYSIAWLDAISKFEKGTYNIRIETSFTKPYRNRDKKKSKVVAKGSFSLVLDGSKIKTRPSFAEVKKSEKGKLSNPALEAQLLKVLQEHADYSGWKEKFHDLFVTSNAWTIVRNELTGVILSRRVFAYGYAQMKDGSCRLQSFGFSQAYDGSTFDNGLMEYMSVGGTKPVSCK